MARPLRWPQKRMPVSDAYHDEESCLRKYLILSNMASGSSVPEHQDKLFKQRNVLIMESYLLLLSVNARRSSETITVAFMNLASSTMV